MNVKLLKIIEAFDYLNGFIGTDKDKSYLNIHKQRYIDTLLAVPDLRKEAKVLDTGSGFGHLSVMVKHILGCDVYAVDKRTILMERLSPLGITYKQNDFVTDSLPFDDNTFDLVLFCEVLEHFNFFPQKVLYEIYRVLKPGGYVLLTTPNLYSLLKRVRFAFGKRIIEPYSYPGDEKHVPKEFLDFDRAHTIMQERLHKRKGFGGSHFREYDMKETCGLLVETGFKIIKDVYPRPQILFSENNVALDLNPLHIAYRFISVINPQWRNQMIVLAEKT
jgi:SAM-dependent methyltransferase